MWVVAVCVCEFRSGPVLLLLGVDKVRPRARWAQNIHFQSAGARLFLIRGGCELNFQPGALSFTHALR